MTDAREVRLGSVPDHVYQALQIIKEQRRMTTAEVIELLVKSYSQDIHARGVEAAKHEAARRAIIAQAVRDD